MSDRTAIEWTDATWNPVRARNLKSGKIGWHCEHATTGCESCYAEGFNRRLGTGLPFKPGHRQDLEIFLDDEVLSLPLRWKKPRVIFVCSMSDLFADFVELQWIAAIFAIMALTPRHTFQILTKRAERMQRTVDEWLTLPNVWLGVSAERQEEADERIPHLLRTPAAVRFVSLEPLLGPIDLRRVATGERTWINALTGLQGARSAAGHGGDFDKMFASIPAYALPSPAPRVDWAIVGGESGARARPMEPEWARDLRDQCGHAGVPFFFKQWGGKDKKAAGRALDNVEHNGFPEPRA